MPYADPEPGRARGRERWTNDPDHMRSRQRDQYARHRDARRSDKRNMSPEARELMRQTCREWNARNTDRKRAYQRAYNKAHAQHYALLKRALYDPEKQRIRNAAYREANRERLMQKDRDYYREHRAERLAYNRARNARPEVREAHRVYKRAHQHQHTARAREWRHAHPDLVRRYRPAPAIAAMYSQFWRLAHADERADEKARAEK